MRIFDNLLTILTIAYRNTIRQKRRTIVVATTASMGILCVIISQGFINGFFDSLVMTSVDSGLGHAQIRPAGYLDSRQTGLALENPEELEARFQKELPPHVTYAPRMEREAILRLGAEARGVMLLGVDVKREAGVSAIPTWMVSGSFFKEKMEPQAGALSKTPCLIGTKNAELVEVDVGDWVVITTGGKDGISRSFRCYISGIFRSPAGKMDEALVLMKREDLSRIRNDGPINEVSYFVFHGRDMAESKAITMSLKNSLRGTTGIEIATMQEMEPSIADLFVLYDQMTVIFYFIILMGFGIVLFESITMSIFERMREIGVMHAIGTPPSFLFWLVIMEAFCVTVVGIVFGMILGSVLVFVLNIVGVNMGDIDMGTQTWGGTAGVVRPYLTPKDFLDCLVISLVVSFFSGLYPAAKAIRLSPIKAIYNR